MSSKKVTSDYEDSRTVLFEEVIRQRTWSTANRRSIQSRGTILASSSTFAVIFQALSGGSQLAVMSAVFALVAAVLGVVAVVPRMRDEVEPMTFRMRLYQETAEDLTVALIDHHLHCLKKEREANETLAWVIQTGFAFLICSILMAIISQFIVGR